MMPFGWTALLLTAILAVACNRSEKQVYKAPRNLGESVLSWADVSSSTGASDCLEGKLECSPYYLGTKEKREALAVRASILYKYVALLDFDYDPEPVSDRPGQDPMYMQLKVRSIVEEYVNLIPGGAWDDILVDGICDEKGHCIMYEGSYPMPLWSGTSVVFGRVWCPTVDYPKTVVWISEVYPVEKDTIYDFFGFGYDWNEVREALKKAGESTKDQPLACPTEDENPPTSLPAPPSNEGGTSQDIIIGLLPDPA